MLAGALRIAQLVELAASLAAAAWLHAARGWGPLAMALLVVGWFAGARLALVSATFLLGWLHRSPRAPAERIGVLAGAAMVLAEWRALLMANLVYLPWERLALRPDPVPAGSARVPVILLHGYFANRGYFRPLVAALEGRGIAPVFAPTAAGVTYAIEDYADELHGHVERIVAATGQARVVLVGHSMGGLVARAYVARHGARRVARLVSLGSPHHGSWLARLGVGANALEMRPGSAFLTELERSEAAAGTPVSASLYSPHDNMVMPQSSSRVEGARNIALPGLGHISMLRSPKLAAALVDELQGAGAAPAR